MTKAQLFDKLQQEMTQSTRLQAEVSRLTDVLKEERARNDYHRSLLGECQPLTYKDTRLLKPVRSLHASGIAYSV